MDTILRLALRKYNGLRQQIDSMLLGDDGDVVEAELRKFVAKRPCWADGKVTKVTKPISNPRILELVGTTTVLATTKRFVAKLKFKLKKDGGFCSGFSDNFDSWFLTGESKVEEPVGGGILQYHKLLRWSKDLPIITELGGEEKSETTLSEMFQLLEKQKDGGAGTLLADGLANIFYIRDFVGVLRAVGAYWDVGGWRLYANALESPNEWYGGRHVFSRKPSVA